MSSITSFHSSKVEFDRSAAECLAQIEFLPFNMISFFTVIPGLPKIDLVRENAFNASIYFSRAIEMTCFGRQTAPLLTEITLFPVDDTNQRNISSIYKVSSSLSK